MTCTNSGYLHISLCGVAAGVVGNSGVLLRRTSRGLSGQNERPKLEASSSLGFLHVISPLCTGDRVRRPTDVEYAAEKLGHKTSTTVSPVD